MPARGSSSSPARASSKVDLKIYAITLRAATLLSESGEMREAGCRDRSAANKLCAAAMAKSVDEDIGVRPLVGNHATVLAMRYPHVSPMYT